MSETPAPPPRPATAPGLRLRPLDCPGCGAPLAAEGADVVFYCTACRNAYRLGEAQGGDGALERVEVRFVAAPHVAVARHLPFWLLPARVVIHERQASAARAAGLLAAFLGASGEAGGGGAAYFVVPAFSQPLAAAIDLTTRLSSGLPALGDLLGERLTGGTLCAEDAKTLAHYALLLSEVARPDTLRNLRYELSFGEPCLLGRPFVRNPGGEWIDAVGEIAVRLEGER